MSAIARVTHKIFGRTGATANFGEFGSALAGSPVQTKDITSIMSLGAWDAGWQSAVVGTNHAATLEEVNAVELVHSTQMAYIFQSGIPEWDAATTYYIGSVVRVGAYWYISLIDANLNNTPPAANSNASWLWANQPQMPPGASLSYNGFSCPSGFLWEDGTQYLRATYAALFAALYVAITGTVASGSDTITGIASTVGLGVGMFVEGTGIPIGAKILTVGASTLKLDQTCTAPGTVSIKVSPWGFGDGTQNYFNVPDKRDRVTVNAGSVYTAGKYGGAATVTLTAAESGQVAHTHPLDMASVAGGGGSGGGYNEIHPGTGLSTDPVTGASALSAHENMPPYMACRSIIKY